MLKLDKSTGGRSLLRPHRTFDPMTSATAPHQPPDRALLADLYRQMKVIRIFEDVAVAAHRAGEFAGYIHSSAGQEAVPVGVCAALRREDRITSTHRGHGHGLAKGSDLDGMMAELYGRATGLCGGKGGSMHVADFSVGMLGANGIVAGGIPIACGAAQGLRLMGRTPSSPASSATAPPTAGPSLRG